MRFNAYWLSVGPVDRLFLTLAQAKAAAKTYKPSDWKEFRVAKVQVEVDRSKVVELINSAAGELDFTDFMGEVGEEWELTERCGLRKVEGEV